MSRSLTIIFVIIAIAFLLGQILFGAKMYTGSLAWQVFLFPRVVIASLANTSALLDELRDLRAENLSLSAQLWQAQHSPGVITAGKESYIRAAVYSEYPLNNEGSILVAAGKNQGVSLNSIVLLRPGVFVGEVVEVFANQSRIRTLFDPGWELPVKIGGDRIDSLLVGGHIPRLTLISKKNLPNLDASVYLAAKKYPYGLQVGTLGRFVEGSQNLFAEAELTMAQLPAEFEDVLIMPL